MLNAGIAKVSNTFRAWARSVPFSPWVGDPSRISSFFLPGSLAVRSINTAVIERCISNRISGRAQRRQSGRAEEAAEESRRAPRGAREVREIAKQVVDRQRAAIGEARLEVVPDLFVGVELGGVGGKAFEVQPRVAGTQGADGRSLVNRPAVPEEDHRAVQMPQQQAEEHGDLDMADVGEVKVAVEPEAVPARADGDGRDRRNALVRVPMAQQRCDPARRPGTTHRRDQQEAALVEEGQVRPQAPGFFLIATQRARFHCAIACSFRSTARLSGF